MRLPSVPSELPARYRRDRQGRSWPARTAGPVHPHSRPLSPRPTDPDPGDHSPIPISADARQLRQAAVSKQKRAECRCRVDAMRAPVSYPAISPRLRPPSCGLRAGRARPAVPRTLGRLVAVRLADRCPLALEGVRLAAGSSRTPREYRNSMHGRIRASVAGGGNPNPGRTIMARISQAGVDRVKLPIKRMNPIVPRIEFGRRCLCLADARPSWCCSGGTPPPPRAARRAARPGCSRQRPCRAAVGWR